MDLFQPLSTIDPSEIRTIKLFPAHFGDVVRCELEHVSLEADEFLLYAAVSYHWGDPKRTKPILLNEQQYPVTENLYSFLRHAQSILSAIIRFIPTKFRQGGQHDIVIVQAVVYSILADHDFSLDFPSISDSTLEDLVNRHVTKVIDEAYNSDYESDVTAQQREERLRWLPTTNGSHEPGGRYLRLWIDALCINQHDPNERSQQVSRMRDIYGRSAQLLIWPLDSTTSLSDIKAVVEFVRDIDITTRPYYDGVIGFDDLDHQITLDSFLHPRLESIYKVRKIITQNWFQRMWIIQEVAVAPSSAIFLLGFFPISFRFFMAVVYTCVGSMAFHSPHAGLGSMLCRDAKNAITLCDIEKEYKELKERSKLSRQRRLPMEVPHRLKQLLQRATGRFRATKPHDHLYALLGLLGTDDIPPEIYPDYSMPLEQVFHHYTVYLIKNIRDVSFLSCHKSELTGVPSWVPDWRFVRFEEESSNLTYVEPLHVVISEEGSCLEIDGIVLGEVLTVVHPTQIEGDMKNTCFFKDPDNQPLLEVAAGLLIIRGGMQRLKDMCFSNLSAVDPEISLDCIQYHWEKLWPFSEDEKYHSVSDMLFFKKEVDLDELTGKEAGTLMMIIAHYICKISTTGLGILGSSAMVTTSREDEPIRPDDVICLFNGIRKPCILRRNGPHYRFIAICDMASFPMGSAEERFLEGYEVRRFVLV